MKQAYVIAVDIGTTSTKTLVIDRQGKVHASHSIEYPLYTPRTDIAEQDPDEILQAVVQGVRRVIDKSGIKQDELLCVSFSSAMHSLIAVDRNVQPLTRCITWADNRSARYAEILKADGRGTVIYRSTGTPIHPMSPLLKLMWMKEHDKPTFEKAYKFIGIKEYVFAKLFKRFIVDYSIASTSGLFNLEQLDWDALALETAGISRERLSEPVTTTYKLQGLEQQYAQTMGLQSDTPFVVGASDGVLANLGIGAIDPGVYAITIGTSGAVRGVVNKPLTDPQGRLFCYALNEQFWVVGGAINNGGIMLRWVRDQLATKEADAAIRSGRDAYDYLIELAAGIKPGADGLIFLPLLAGERAPYWNSDARGVFFGLSLYHQKQHMIRAVLEGVVYRIQSVLSALEELAGPTKEIKASGGFARSELWCQMLADVSGARLSIPNSIESSGLGAAKLGLLGMGEIRQLQELDHWAQTERQLTAVESHHELYRELMQIYMNVYHQLQHEFSAISAFQYKYGDK